METIRMMALGGAAVCAAIACVAYVAVDHLEIAPSFAVQDTFHAAEGSTIANGAAEDSQSSSRGIWDQLNVNGSEAAERQTLVSEMPPHFRVGVLGKKSTFVPETFVSRGVNQRRSETRKDGFQANSAFGAAYLPETLDRTHEVERVIQAGRAFTGGAVTETAALKEAKSLSDKPMIRGALENLENGAPAASVSANLIPNGQSEILQFPRIAAKGPRPRPYALTAEQERWRAQIGWEACAQQQFLEAQEAMSY